jgi:hypothetical protein
MRWQLMPDEMGSPTITSEQITGIPLHLIPKTIAEQIKGKRESIFQITVEKKFHNRYTVIVETRDEHVERLHQELPAQKEGDGHG